MTGINPKSYKDIVLIDDELRDKLPTSYDVIGNIALIKIDDDLLKFKKQIGEALTQVNKNIKTVCLTKPVSGEYRTRDIEIIAGDKQTQTCHQEFNLKFYIDIKKTYFSPRLANERKRISKLVKPGEVVVDMFTGVAPFTIMIAKNANPKIIYAVDKNRDAINYAKKNITVNRVLDKVELIKGDANNLPALMNRQNVKADRIIMNLPFSAFNFFETAIKIISDQGTIHYYDIQNEKGINKRVADITKMAVNNKIKILNFNTRRIKSYSPHEFYIGIDITAKRI